MLRLDESQWIDDHPYCRRCGRSDSILHTQIHIYTLNYYDLTLKKTQIYVFVRSILINRYTCYFISNEICVFSNSASAQLMTNANTLSSRLSTFEIGDSECVARDTATTEEIPSTTPSTRLCLCASELIKIDSYAFAANVLRRRRVENSGRKYAYFGLFTIGMESHWTFRGARFSSRPIRRSMPQNEQYAPCN